MGLGRILIQLKAYKIKKGGQQKEKYRSKNFGESGTKFCKNSNGQQVYVLLLLTQVADRNEKAFQIRGLAYGRKYCHMCEEMNLHIWQYFGKEVRSIHFKCNEFKNIK